MNLDAVLAFSAAFCGGALAFAVGWFERQSIAHRSFVAGMLVFAADSIFSGLSAVAILPDEIVYWQDWRLLSMSLLPGFWLFFSLCYGRGNHREFLRRWRYVLGLAFLLPLVSAIFFWNSFITSTGRTSADSFVLKLGTPGVVLNVLFLIGAILVLMNLERTFRASVGIMRWRIKFMVIGLAVLFIARSYTSSQIILFHAIDLSLQTVNSAALIVATLLIFRSLLREGHFEMDVYPSHAVLQKSLTIVLAGVYLIIMGLFANLVAIGGGDTAFNFKAFIVLAALVSLAVFLLSDRARMQLDRFVSRHFQRPLYDYRTVWRKFTDATASCVTQNELCRATLRLIADVFQVLSVSIWFVDEKKEKLIFGGSTFLSETKAAELNPGAGAAEIVNALQHHPEPVDIDTGKEPWAAALKVCHPDEFRKGGNRICVPLIFAGEIHGLIILGDRVGGVTFSPQDFDLLKCVGDQVAASLLNTKLSAKLLEAKELEAFQTMSAFFVHDLKNAASTLNLMLQNLPVHFDDPAFREDALRGTAKTVAHINHLIERLSLLRHELKIKPVESDLNEAIARPLADWEKTSGFRLVKNFEPMPKVLIDSEQLLKVVTNLVLNAKEAISADGEIKVGTKRMNGWAILSVSDNGCGMSPEFLNRSLFRPFQTTKKNGLGIGMFQSKMIVEAHKGRIEVESRPGNGTTFRIFLPLQK